MLRSSSSQPGETARSGAGENSESMLVWKPLFKHETVKVNPATAEIQSGWGRTLLLQSDMCGMTR